MSLNRSSLSSSKGEPKHRAGHAPTGSVESARREEPEIALQAVHDSPSNLSGPGAERTRHDRRIPQVDGPRGPRGRFGLRPRGHPIPGPPRSGRTAVSPLPRGSRGRGTGDAGARIPASAPVPRGRRAPDVALLDRVPRRPSLAPVAETIDVHLGTVRSRSAGPPPGSGAGGRPASRSPAGNRPITPAGPGASHRSTKRRLRSPLPGGPSE